MYVKKYIRSQLCSSAGNQINFELMPSRDFCHGLQKIVKTIKFDYFTLENKILLTYFRKKYFSQFQIKSDSQLNNMLLFFGFLRISVLCHTENLGEKRN